MNLIPSSIVKLLDTEHKKSHQERIIDYLVSDGRSLELTEHELYLLKRWRKADDFLGANRYTSKEVVHLLVKYFQSEERGYSIATAYRDIDDARFVFGSTRKMNKPYRLHAHLERLEEMMIYWQKKDGKVFQKLADSYTYALSLIKDEGVEKPATPVIVLNFGAGDFLPSDFTPADAEEVAKEVLENRGIASDYLDFEES